MVGFFNQKSSFRAAMQVANGVALVIASYQMLTDPDAVIGMDLMIHALSCITFRNSDNALASIGTTAINFSSLGSIYTQVATGSTALPWAATLTDSVLHTANILAGLSFRSNSQPEETSAPSILER